MPLYLIVLAELIVLFLLSQSISKSLYGLFYLLIRSKQVAISLLTFLFLPGTVVHEFAHLITAEILRVPTGEISFTPEIEANESGQHEVRTGSVKIAQTDPLRRYLIGFAPVFFGVAALVLLIWLFQYFWPQMDTQFKQAGLIGLIGYLLFAVSNNMFSSRKDLEGFIIVVPVLLLIIASAYIAGFRLTLTGQALLVTTQILTGLAKALGIVLGINFVLWTLNRIALYNIRKII